MKILFIGFGNIAKALIAGLKPDKHWQIYAASPHLTAGKSENGIFLTTDNCKEASDSDVIFLAVKPGVINSVAKEISSVVKPSTIIVSLAAGIELATIQSFFAPQQPILRAMPNTPTAVGAGVIALFANIFVNAAQQKQLHQLLKNTGDIFWLAKEEDINIFTALAGSGPAYVFLFIEALSKGAEQLGLDAKIAAQVARQTLKGAVTLLEKSVDTAQELRNKVTSKGGTTAAGIGVLEANSFATLVDKALSAAYKRALEIAKND